MGLALAALVPGVIGPAHAAGTVASARAETPEVRTVTELAQGWRFRKGGEPAFDAAADDSAWERVSVPHTWNRVGVYEAAAGVPGSGGRQIDKYMGAGWYRLTFTAPQPRSGGRFWLEFDAASRTAEVWLNAKRLGAHQGGFARFRFDATDAIRPGAGNLLAVKVDNSTPAPGGATADTLPLVGDFFVQGGLYRPVRLIETGPVHFALDDFGGPGVYARTEAVEAGSARVSVLARLSNQGRAAAKGMVTARLVRADGAVAAETSQKVRLTGSGAGEARLDLAVPSPRLWQGTSDPYLYTLRTELRDGRGRLLDVKSESFGIRQFRIDPAQGFFINGRHVPLHGVGLHQDSMESGWAMSREQIADRMATIRDMGANTIRLTHYQHGQPIHDLADRYGLVLWDEIALVTAWTLDEAQGEAPPAIRAQARRQLQELIRQNYNHVSVAVWGIANEVDFGPNRPDFFGKAAPAQPVDPSPLLADLAAIVAAEDPSRPATLATCCEGQGQRGVPVVAKMTPVAAANRYFGWYYGKPDQLGPHLDALHAERGDQPQALTEYGAGGALSLHTDNVLGGAVDSGGHDQPEEYQAWVHEQSWPQLAARPHVWATWLWNAFDFATVTRTEGDTRDINTKGLVSYDGRIRKDAFYYYRAQWSAEPTVHIAGRRYVDRAYPVADVRVYSNAPATELKLNGRSLGLRSDCPNRICIWAATPLQPGENRLEAVGSFANGPTSDAIVWQLDPTRRATYRIDSGALIGAPGFGSDAFFSGGQANSADRRPRGRPAVLAPIVPAEQRVPLASYREGEFSYRLPLPPGEYRVTLHFVEPAAKPGERVFDVRANGAVQVEALDIAASAAAPFAEVTRSFAVKLAQGPLDLAFVPRQGKAIVSAIEVVPVGPAR
ncbi:DUF4982 domain-containing protein [Novosphingobium flavum]|uniref:DUF4982 domain-containing protein n=1 Tax=Novosphingobium flavum TaxID=1778672 RepID=A0A7X1FVT8_9SPHN|nr:DUF4982 domain-containing protein [Novosphingobium flavum]